MRLPRRLALFTGLTFTLCPAFPLIAQRAPGGPEVRHVHFEGVHALAGDLVELALDTRETHCKSFLLAPFCALGAGWAERRAWLDPAAVARDTTSIRRLYADWGYPEAHATAEVVPAGGNAVSVLYRITEGQPVRVRSIAVQGLEGTGVGPPALPLQAGKPYAPVLLDEAQRVVLTALAAAGRPFGQVEVTGDVAPGSRQADVVLRVTPGPVGVFGRTIVQAHPPLDSGVVLRRVAWREGERFDPAAIARTEERLYRVPVIDSARVLPARRSPADSAVDVTVSAAAGRISALQGAGSLSASACLSGQAWWSDRYLAGKPRVVTLSAGASNLLVSSLRGFPCTSAGEGPFADPDYFARGDWREPVGADTWLLLSGGYSRQSAPGAYIQRGVDARIGLDRNVRPGLELVLSYAPSRVESTAGGPFFCALYGACAGPDLSALQSATTLAPLGLDLVWAPPAHTQRTLGPAPTALGALGPPVPRWIYSLRASVSGGAAPTLSAVNFTRGELFGTVTRRLGGPFELALRGRAGAVAAFGDTLPPQLRLFGGGPNGVRGAQQNLLGPRILVADSGQLASLACGTTAASCAGATVRPDQVQVRATGGNLLVETGAEARVWVSSAVQLAVFTDWGYLRSGARAGAPADVAPAETMLSPGVGLRLLTPVGPFRLDFAYDPTRTPTYPLLLQRSDGTFLDMGEVVYDPYGGKGGGGLAKLRRRIQLQFSLGQPF